MKHFFILISALLYGMVTINIANALLVPDEEYFERTYSEHTTKTSSTTATNPFDVCKGGTAGTLAGCQDSTINESTPGHINQNAKNTFINTYLPNIVTQIALIAAALCIIMLLYSGIMYITNMDNPKEITTATDIAVWSLIGLFISMGAYLIMFVINNLL